MASVSQIYTLAATLSILRDAKIGLSAPLSQFFPGFDARITIQLLMAHASGISFAVQRLEGVDAGDWIFNADFIPLVTPDEFHAQMRDESKIIRDGNVGSLTVYITDTGLAYRKSYHDRLCVHNA